ncbi:CLUMA_CG006402, isoform A [Clunio marinus]|uniref:CLUMA_CG006402, isoform A n=1 Tax=Clunio marinus TaxID=568069 RepID=A0A1J1HX56_9DIPT|nr:CLUMA_CG006402, isoform A [Clunio marinus]
MLIPYLRGFKRAVFAVSDENPNLNPKINRPRKTLGFIHPKVILCDRMEMPHHDIWSINK